MPIIQQPQQPKQPSFSRQASDIKSQRRLAQLLAQSQSEYNPNAQVSGFAVPTSTTEHLARALQTGFGSYLGASADKRETELEDAKTKAISESFAGGKKPDINDLAAQGLVSGDDLVKAMLARKSATENRYQPTNQVVMGKDGQLHLRRYGSDPDAEIIEDTATLPNQLRYLDTGLGYEPVPTKGVPPQTLNAPLQSPQVNPQQSVNVDISPNASPEDRAYLESIAKSNNVAPTYQQPGIIPKHLSLAQEKQYSPQVQGNIAGAEAKAKADVEIKKEADIVAQNEKIGAEKLSDTLGLTYKYLYPGGIPERDAQGRLIPPKKQMILGNSPVDRTIDLAHKIGVDSDLAVNTESFKRNVRTMVLDKLGGKLGAQISDSDRKFIVGQISNVEKAQHLDDVYASMAAIEDRIKLVESKQGIQTKNAPSNGLTLQEQEELNQLKARFSK